jgi:hypothetical protein
MKTTTDNRSSAKVFIAKLANLPDWQALSEKEKEALYTDFTQWWTHPEKDLHPDLKRWAGLQYLRSLLVAAQTLLRPLLEGHAVKLSVEYEMVAQLQGKKLAETLLGPKTELDLANVKVETFLQESPFPFGLCSRCKKVFVHPPVGRRRRFCSATCQINGAPGQRAAYMRTYRHGQRKRELVRARVILRQTPLKKQRQALYSAFPTKSDRQLRSLQKQVEQTGAVTGTPNARRDR